MHTEADRKILHKTKFFLVAFWKSFGHCLENYVGHLKH